MRHRLTIIFSVLLIIHCSLDGICQIKVSGHVFDSENLPIIGCTVQEFGTINGTASGENGEFSIIVNNDSSVLLFYFPGYKKLMIRIDTCDKDNIRAILVQEPTQTDEIIIVSTNVPSSIEIGYIGLFNNRPVGLHLEYSTFRLLPKGYINVMTKNFDNPLFSFELGPYKISKSSISKYLNLYFKGYFDQSNSNLFLCTRIYAIRRLTLNFGLGNESFQAIDNRLIFLTGIRSSIPFPALPVPNILEINAFYNKQTFDFATTLYLEFYNENYRNLSMGIGYQSLFGSRDLIANINYKQYFIDRKKGVF